MTKREKYGLMSLSCLALALIGIVVAVSLGGKTQSEIASQPQWLFQRTFKIDPSKPWQNSHIQIHRGDTVNVTSSSPAENRMCWAHNTTDGSDCPGPAGTWYTPNQLPDKRGFQMMDARCGSLIARINGVLYAVGTDLTFTSQTEGPIEFMINDRYIPRSMDYLFDNTGEVNAVVSVKK
jgi:hypothetical protein